MQVVAKGLYLPSIHVSLQVHGKTAKANGMNKSFGFPTFLCERNPLFQDETLSGAIIGDPIMLLTLSDTL